MIHWLCRRMVSAFQEQIASSELMIVIVTSEVPGNELLNEAVLDLPVHVFYGADGNIPLRQLQCAKAFGLEAIISVDGDDVLCSFQAARDVFEALRSGGAFDIARVEGLPLGMNCQGYRTNYLERSLLDMEGAKLETGWGRVFSEPRLKIIRRGDHDLMGDLRFTLDYPEDALFFAQIIEALAEGVLTMNDHDLVAYVSVNGLERTNAHLKERYWTNYDMERTREGNG
jgi:spore coat polysaccharide biosynthesis protein SpsF